MKIITTFVHGILDYLVGIALLVAPNLFGFAGEGGAAEWLPRILGIVVLLQAVMTRYELGLAKVIPMQAHLMMDYVLSLLLAVSPWLFGFADRAPNVWMPHVIVGLAVFLVSLLTDPEPRRLHARAH